MQIVQAQSDAQLDQARQLFDAYAQWLGVDLSFQDFATEINHLPGAYAPPRGALLLAYQGTDLAGCVALRPWQGSIAELKRLYVVPRARRCGVGRALMQRVIAIARQVPYRFVRLDTLPSMQSAQQLYARFGFYDIDAYYHNPLDGARYMELAL